MNKHTTIPLDQQQNISGKPLPQSEVEARLHLDNLKYPLSTLQKLDAFFVLNYIPVLTSNRLPRKGNVYVMRCGDVYKIGLSTSPERRKLQIAEYVPGNIEIILTLNTWDMYGLEQSLHSTFLGSKVSGQREWFFLTPDDIEFIRGLAL